jgi:demethylmenaquinone methyltransferase/2-methoxy-6-polyprenyl-1,4-benzoquinol methylase
VEVKPYDQAESKKKQVSKMFDSIAHKYDFLNHFLSLGIDKFWRRKAIRLLAESNPQLILDVATGTADVAILTARMVPESKITGIDISPQMLQVGRNKIQKENLQDRIDLIDGDAEKLPFGDNIFDAVTVAYGVRNFEDLEAGLGEINRVLKKNGKLVVIEFSKPTVFPVKQLYYLYFKYILPLIGKVTSKDPKAYRYLFESVQAFPDGKDFISILKKTGFNQNQCISLTLGICSIYIGTK